MNNWLRQRPWIWIILFFLAFLGVWASFITLAVKNAPPPVAPPPARLTPLP